MIQILLGLELPASRRDQVHHVPNELSRREDVNPHPGFADLGDGGLVRQLHRAVDHDLAAIGFGDLPMITAGIIKPDTGDFEVLVPTDPKTSTYRKVVLNNNRLVGFICLNKVDRAGILTGLIKDRVDVGGFKDRLLNHDFGYVDFPEDYRKSKLSGEGA